MRSSCTTTREQPPLAAIRESPRTAKKTQGRKKGRKARGKKIMKERKMQYYLFEDPSVAGFKYCSFSLLSPRWALCTRPFVVGMVVGPRDMGVSQLSRTPCSPLLHAVSPRVGVPRKWRSGPPYLTPDRVRLLSLLFLWPRMTGFGVICVSGSQTLIWKHTGFSARPTLPWQVF